MYVLYVCLCSYTHVYSRIYAYIAILAMKKKFILVYAYCTCFYTPLRGLMQGLYEKFYLGSFFQGNPDCKHQQIVTSMCNWPNTESISCKAATRWWYHLHSSPYMVYKFPNLVLDYYLTKFAIIALILVNAHLVNFKPFVIDIYIKKTVVISREL